MILSLIPKSVTSRPTSPTGKPIHETHAVGGGPVGLASAQEKAKDPKMAKMAMPTIMSTAPTAIGVGLVMHQKLRATHPFCSDLVFFLAES